MTGKQLSRIDNLGETIRVVERDHMRFSPYKSNSVLLQEHPDLFTHVTNEDGDIRVRVGTGQQYGDCDGWQIHGDNAVFVEAPLTERELTSEEVDWCEDTFNYSGDNRPETVYEIVIPHPEQLRTTIENQQWREDSEVTAFIENHDRRHRQVTKLQSELEEKRVRQNQLKPRQGIITDVLPEWDPENGHNDDRSRQHLYDMASMQTDTHLQDFELLTGLNYYAFWKARKRVLQVHEPKLDAYDIVGLDVAGRPEWTYCRRCGSVAPEEAFLFVTRRGREDQSKFRVCDYCAELDVKGEYAGLFTEVAVAKAKGERAKRVGGQQKLTREYNEESEEESVTESEPES